MSHPSKVKGSNFEREIVNMAKLYGLEAKRAYASNGESLGCEADVDCVIEGWKVQAKRRKKIASFLTPEGSAHIQVIRGDRQPAYAVLMLEDLLQLIKDTKQEK